MSREIDHIHEVLRKLKRDAAEVVSAWYDPGSTQYELELAELLIANNLNQLLAMRVVALDVARTHQHQMAATTNGTARVGLSRTIAAAEALDRDLELVLARV
ncbi:hypothetical protein [Amantichitinum ursilacus]|uniref:Uncharacterized protein n=1 Tax=Amantichitinum ursilacus TaxID=857265 RepID=A0A0N0GMM2_9NEIS|nr:hypothetical protein [Amantichitinum ursilacus]KPC51898.1 hypothetical protein WG78_14985 [Amantichitinum ursilacus]